MRRLSLLCFFSALCVLPLMSAAQALPLRLMVQLEADAGVAALVCPPREKPAKATTTAAPPAAGQAPQDPQEMPDEQDLQGLLQTLPMPSDDPLAVNRGDGPSAPGLRRPQGQPWRIGIWGDSHTAAAFWSDALARQIAPGQTQAAVQFYPANFLRPGVRHPSLKRTCLQGAWRHESAHAQSLAQSLPGPGLVSMHTQEAGSTLEVDVRGAGQTVAPHAWRWLLQNQDASRPLQLAFSADGGAEQVLLLPASDQAVVVHVQSPQPLSRLRLRLVSGHLRLQGLAASSPEATLAEPLRMDVFGYPGATLAGWQTADMDRFLAWKPEWDGYDLVVLAYGTNEGNARPFHAAAYRQMLEQALGNLRRAFPHSACLLVGPGDRGVLIRRSQKRSLAAAKQRKLSAKGQSQQQAAAKKAVKPPLPAKSSGLTEAQLLQFSHVHAQINRIQKELGAAHGCVAWSAQEAMGGLGSAYRWGLQKPPLMARDLIHFTAAGYQELAKRLAKDMGWAE